MEPKAQASNRSNFSALMCRSETAQAIVQPLIEMSLFVMELGHASKRQVMQDRTERLQEAKKKLAELMEGKFKRPFWPERFSNFHVGTNPRMGGYFDLTFNETTPSKEGNVVNTYRVRLCGLSRDTTLDKCVHFVQANNPLARSVPYDMGRQLLDAMGI